MRMILITIASMALAQPALASQTAAKPTAPAKSGQQAAEPKYCLQYEELTGSRTSARKECRTKAAWARQGIDVSKMADR